MFATPPHAAVASGIVGKLHDAARRHDRKVPGRNRIPTLFLISGDELVALDDYIRSLCPSEGTCTVCGGRLCSSCNIGDPVRCTDDPRGKDRHHSDCQDACDGCVANLRRSES